MQTTRAIHPQRILKLKQAALPYLAVARISGADAAGFLHGQLSADIAKLEDGGATFACYCSPRGQVYALFLVCRSGDEFRLIANVELLPAMLKRLGAFVMRARVKLEPAHDLVVCAVTADELASGDGPEFMPPGLDIRYALAGIGSCSVAESATWKERELRRNIVWLGPQTTERFIPQMLGFDRIGAVSFNKGCYPGQEIIARARYLGQVKRKPLVLRVSATLEPPQGGALQLKDGEQWLPGTIVDSVVARSTDSTGETLVLVVSPIPSGAVETVEYEGSSYRCATI